jgi:hypothetical protein
MTGGGVKQLTSNLGSAHPLLHVNTGCEALAKLSVTDRRQQRVLGDPWRGIPAR